MAIKGVLTVISTYQPDGGPIVRARANEMALFQLQERMSKSPNVIPFVGAGLSVAFGYPTWRQLIEHGAERAECASEVEPLIGRGDWEEAMGIIAERMPAIKYRQFLKYEFSPDRPDRPRAFQRPPAVLFLPALTKTPVVTTNIDAVLEGTFEHYGSPIEVIVGARRDRIIDALEVNQPCLIKIHGDYREGEDRILTAKEYDKHYGKSKGHSVRKPLPGMLRGLLAGRSFLFLGYGMEKRTLRLLASLGTEAMSSHWILWEEPGTEEEKRARAAELAATYVSPIWYRHGHHEDIGPFLHWLTYLSASGESSIKKFYAALGKADYVAAVAAVDDVPPAERDPGLDWNIDVARELAVRQLLVSGQLPSALRELGAAAVSYSILAILEDLVNGPDGVTATESPGGRGKGLQITASFVRSAQDASLRVVLEYVTGASAALTVSIDGDRAGHDFMDAIRRAVQDEAVDSVRAITAGPARSNASVELALLETPARELALADPVPDDVPARSQMYTAARRLMRCRQAQQRAADATGLRGRMKRTTSGWAMQRATTNWTNCRRALGAYAASLQVPTREDWFGHE